MRAPSTKPPGRATPCPNARNPSPRDAFALFRPVPTRWMDNDVYGHVNNVVYYSYFDTAVNAYLVENGLLDVTGSDVVGLVAETGCSYFESVAFPRSAGYRARREQARAFLGDLPDRRVSRRSRTGSGSGAVRACLRVTREWERPAPIPDATRTALEKLLIA